MSNLYAIDADLAQLLALAEDGELSAELAEALDALAGERLEKVQAILCVMRNREARAAGIQAEIDRLTAAREAERRTVDRLKAYLRDSMAKHGETRIETPLFTVRVQQSPPAVRCSVDPHSLPLEFQREKLVVELDRAKLLEAWKYGVPLPDGVTVEVGSHLRIQ